ncbi:Extracellular calcium-sensing receptor [Oryzias melastigma]|uniref:Extracellular calcium-sensing receptor n=1 Tax=Oryzias melastigma TaxID=30732 RepID=A0A834C9Y1_ORYME|nr:Extracellular calcium-sensing receptor [Oryzias melastigma]
MYTMTFAIKEINKRSDFLSNITLGFHIRDSCDDIPVSLRATLQLVNGQPESNLPTESIRGNLSTETTTNLGCAAVDRRVSSVIIGDAGSGVSMALLRSLGSFHIPLESVHYGVCAAYTHFYPVDLNQQALDELLDVIQTKTSKVIINFSGESEMQGILREVQRRNMTGLQWIASEAWATAKSLWEKSGKLLLGTLGFAIQRADVIPGLHQHLTSLDPLSIHKTAFLTEFWEETFKCRLNDSINTHYHGEDTNHDRKTCKGTEKLDDVYSPYFDVTQLRVSYNVYKAVYLVAHALQDMSNCKDGEGPFQNGSCANPKNFKPWELLHYMKHANFSVLGKEVNFDLNGDPIAYYDLMNWQQMPDGSLSLVKVGFYDASLPSGQSLVINDSMIPWPAGQKYVAEGSLCGCEVVGLS